MVIVGVVPKVSITFHSHLIAHEEKYIYIYIDMKILIYINRHMHTIYIYMYICILVGGFNPSSPNKREHLNI